MKFELNKDALTIYLEGEFNSSNAEQIGQEIDKIVNKTDFAFDINNVFDIIQFACFRYNERQIIMLGCFYQLDSVNFFFLQWRSSINARGKLFLSYFSFC